MSDTVSYDRSTIVGVFRDLEELVVSLDRIGSHVALEGLSPIEDARVLREFVDQWQLFRKLSHARSVLGDAFSRDPGPDGMDELERECETCRFWSAPRSGDSA